MNREMKLRIDAACLTRNNYTMESFPLLLTPRTVKLRSFLALINICRPANWVLMDMFLNWWMDRNLFCMRFVAETIFTEWYINIFAFSPYLTKKCNNSCIQEKELLWIITQSKPIQESDYIIPTLLDTRLLELMVLWLRILTILIQILDTCLNLV